MVKEIIWTETSLRDRIGIFEFWLKHNNSPSYSEKLETLFKESAKLLAQFPQIGTATDYTGVRVKVIRNYNIFYRDTPTTVEVIRVWDTRQNPQDLELEP